MLHNAGERAPRINQLRRAACLLVLVASPSAVRRRAAGCSGGGALCSLPDQDMPGRTISRALAAPMLKPDWIKEDPPPKPPTRERPKPSTDEAPVDHLAALLANVPKKKVSVPHLKQRGRMRSHTLRSFGVSVARGAARGGRGQSQGQKV